MNEHNVMVRRLERKTGIWALVNIVIVISAVSATYIVFRPEDTPEGPSRLVVATTTSLYDTGLLDTLEDVFEAEYSVELYFISVGTGLAISHATRGDADMILVHAPAKEQTFLEDGYGICRKIIAYNFFTIVGPAEDPAQIADLSPTDALTKIVEVGQKGEITWVSRGDDSGTHSKEKGLWASAGFEWAEIREEEWYVESGTGMGKTLQITDEFRGYTLADMGTYLKYSTDELIDLSVLIQSGQELLNVYSAVAVNPAANPNANIEGAIIFIKFLLSEQAQQLISEYGSDTYPETLFYPAVELLKTNSDPTLVGWIEDSAYITGSECPPEYRDGYLDLYE